jgi:hypothetical protein
MPDEQQPEMNAQWCSLCGKHPMACGHALPAAVYQESQEENHERRILALELKLFGSNPRR